MGFLLQLSMSWLCCLRSTEASVLVLCAFFELAGSPRNETGGVGRVLVLVLALAV